MTVTSTHCPYCGMDALVARGGVAQGEAIVRGYTETETDGGIGVPVLNVAN